MSTVFPKSTESAQCLDVKQKLSQAQSDLRSFAPSYASCFPEQAETEKKQTLSSQIATYKGTKQIEFNNEMRVFNDLMNTLQLSNRIQTPVEDYIQELNGEKQNLERENYRLQQQIRAGRRRFLDDDPQGGVARGGTIDDRIMLFFWITYAIFLTVGLMILFGMYGARFGLETTKQKMGFGMTVFFLLYGIAYWAITRYA